jgi:H+/Cl- antiporter ClcA
MNGFEQFLEVTYSIISISDYIIFCFLHAIILIYNQFKEQKLKNSKLHLILFTLLLSYCFCGLIQSFFGFLPSGSSWVKQINNISLVRINSKLKKRLHFSGTLKTLYY